MTMKSDSEAKTGLWLESLNGLKSNKSSPHQAPANFSTLLYAVFFSSVFWLGILLLSHQIW